MECPTCGAVWQQAGDSDDGYARSLCECDHAQKCFKCKRGQHLPVNQAILDLDGDVRHFACSKHGLIVAEDFPLPTPPIGAKPKQSHIKREPPPAPIPNAESRVGMEIIDQGRIVTKWADTKKMVLEDIRSEKFNVICTGCSFKHPYSKRKIEADEGRHYIQIVCPKCSHGGYRILD